MSQLNRRRAIARLLAIPAAALAPGAAFAQEGATLASPYLTVAPLQPAPIDVRIPGYSGPATIILFDARRRYAGTAEGQVADGAGTIVVQPRGAIGPQWAALFASGVQVAANPALFTLDANTTIVAGQPRFDGFVPAAREILSKALLSYLQLDGVTRAHGYRSPDSALIWLRDHVYQQRAARYFDPELRWTFDTFRSYQAPDGSLPDFLPRPYLAPDAYRTPVEADVEYLYVQGIYEAWQALGDDEWARSHLGDMRRAVTYSLQDPLRWDGARGLIKRPFTIDTWDFEYGPTTIDPNSGKPAPRHWIDAQTIWGIFHGDNTGMAQALTMLAAIEDRVGDPGFAQLWRGFAAGIMQNLNRVSWNGRFYRHHVPFEPFDVPGVDEARQLSLSNAYALNRGVLTPQQGQAIVDEYIARANDPRRTAFAEWYSIDPPFPPGAFGLAGRTGERPGEYVNGGIMPLVGGELARGAFRYGNESYGFAILDHYWQRMLSRGRSFLWYRPDGAEGVGSDDTVPFDGWGTAAMLTALIEGAAGIEDKAALMRDVTVSPRWSATNVNSAYAVARYAGSDGYTAYTWERGPGVINVDVTGSADRTRLRILLPPEVRRVVSVTVNGARIPPAIETVRFSRYVVVETGDVVVKVQVRYS